MSESHSLPAFAEVVIIGGGIIGIAAALSLSRDGVSVLLCEKGRLAGEQSSRNWGWVRKTRRDLRELPLALESARIWPRLSELVGRDSGYRQTGMVWGARTEAEVAKFESWISSAKEFNVDTRILSKEELQRLLPESSTYLKCAMYSPTDGWAEPEQASLSMAQAAQAQGASIFAGTAVRGLDIAAGRVRGVVTERGPVNCNSVILAGGAWSRRFLADLGLVLPQLKVRSSVLSTTPVRGGPDLGFLSSDGAFRRRLDGGFTIANSFVNVVPVVPDSFRFFAQFLPKFLENAGGLKLRLDGSFMREWRVASHVPLDEVSRYEQCRVLEPAPDRAFAQIALRKLGERFSFLREANVAHEWAGMIDVLPDEIPVISSVEAMPGLVVATGFSGHGFGIGPSAGALAADIAIGRPPLVDARDFSFERFSKIPAKSGMMQALKG